MPYTEDLEGDYTHHLIDPSKYTSYYGGYVWELDLADT
jgi:hypothetical protein